MDIARRIRQLERGIQLALHRMGMDPTQPEESRERWALLEAYGDLEADGEFRDVIRLVNELELYEALARVEHVRVRPAPADRPGEAALARLEALGYDVHVEDIWGPRDGERWWWARARYEGREVAQAIGATREEALECLMGELGL